MRDTIKDLDYFKGQIEDYDYSIDRKLSKLKKTEDVKIIRKRYWSIFFNTLHKIIANYSIGSEIQEVRMIYLEALDYMQKGWNEKDEDFNGYYSVDDFYDVLTMLSLGYVLNIKNEKLLALVKLKNVVKAPDFLLDTLCAAIKNKPLPTKKEVMLGNTYDSLWEVLQAPTKEEATQLLHKYVKSDWYRKSQAHSWYDSHKSNSYFGYWSFESVALVKLLNLDDTTFKGLKYYPYDLLQNK